MTLFERVQRAKNQMGAGSDSDSQISKTFSSLSLLETFLQQLISKGLEVFEISTQFEGNCA